MYNLFDSQVLKIYQGNSMMLEIAMTDTSTGEPVEMANDDYVLFTVVNKNERVVIEKRLTVNDYDENDKVLLCKIDPQDTINLITGEYKYDMLYVCGNDTPTTFMSSTLIITKAYGKITINEG